ncbi:hypothetical protein OG895_43625 [Streptomyces sp. NBC_00201]|uniref:hypothetical protein n=1 Tax=unclassified Streptomyces TaxID=2593676 RepID=UPI00224DBD74|nr:MULTISPECIES: hypothetical protein [unclassified Streptomyces]MCX5251941.1 hypothetical protein [Streptomyces sp. NBC_00201]MCX5294122.1 hypothetical protein [Streptomyces sp. NBC_00183]
MTTLSCARSKRVAAVSVLTVLAVVVLALGVGVPQGWWPHTGQAFAADAAHRDPCALIVGPAKAYCERGAATTASAGHQDVAGGAWRLVPASAGVGALVVWRLRGAAGRRRR